MTEGNKLHNRFLGQRRPVRRRAHSESLEFTGNGLSGTHRSKSEADARLASSNTNAASPLVVRTKTAPSLSSAQHAARQLDPPPSMPKSLAQMNPRAARDRSRGLVQLVKKVLLKRTQVDYEQQGLENYHKDFLHSSKALMNAMLENMGAHLPQDQAERLSGLYARCQDHGEAMFDRESAIRKEQNGLSSLEFRLHREEEGLHELLNAASLATPSAPTLGSAGLLSHRTSHSSRSSNTPSLLRDYYDRKGDERVYRERLAELKVYHTEDLVNRELLADRDDPLASTDEQFESDYRTRHDAIVADLRAAEVDATELAARCKAAGLDPSINVKRAPSFEDADSTASSTDHLPAMRPPVTSTVLLLDSLFPPPLGSHPGPDQAQTLIRGWLREVEMDTELAGKTDDVVNDGSYWPLSLAQLETPSTGESPMEAQPEPVSITRNTARIHQHASHQSRTLQLWPEQRRSARVAARSGRAASRHGGGRHTTTTTVRRSQSV